MLEEGQDWQAEEGVQVEVGVCADEVRAQLAPYLKHRTTGRPWVVLKLAASVDGRLGQSLVHRIPQFGHTEGLAQELGVESGLEPTNRIAPSDLARLTSAALAPIAT